MCFGDWTVLDGQDAKGKQIIVVYFNGNSRDMSIRFQLRRVSSRRNLGLFKL